MLKYFKETYPQNKNEIIALLNDNYRIIKDEAKRLGSGKKDPVVILFKAFIDKVKQSQLPKCDDWWCYDFEVDSFGVRLFMCYCCDWSTDVTDAPTFTFTEMYELISVNCDMVTVTEYAEMHKVTPVAVRQWIRRGKLRYIRKQGRDWIISSIARPTDKYVPVTYSWNKISASSVKQFPFLEEVDNVRIEQNHSNKTKFIIRCEKDEEIIEVEMADKEKEMLELELLSQESIYFDEDQF